MENSVKYQQLLQNFRPVFGEMRSINIGKKIGELAKVMATGDKIEKEIIWLIKNY